jgi:hypothetical protein
MLLRQRREIGSQKTDGLFTLTLALVIFGAIYTVGQRLFSAYITFLPWALTTAHGQPVDKRTSCRTGAAVTSSAIYCERRELRYTACYYVNYYMLIYYSTQ